MEAVDIQRLRTEDEARERRIKGNGVDMINEARKLLMDYQMHFEENRSGVRLEVLLNNLTLARNQLKQL